MLDGLIETVSLPGGGTVRLDVKQATGVDSAPRADTLATFSLVYGLPVWRHVVGDVVLERRLVMLHGQNTVLVAWRLVAGAERLDLGLQPFLHIRPSDARVARAPAGPTRSSAGATATRSRRVRACRTLG